MTEYQHSTGVAVEVFPDEFKLLLKVINRALDADYLNDEEKDMLISFKDDFTDVALEYAE